LSSRRTIQRHLADYSPFGGLQSRLLSNGVGAWSWLRPAAAVIRYRNLLTMGGRYMGCLRCIEVVGDHSASSGRFFDP
jgi:hypothetical protein